MYQPYICSPDLRIHLGKIARISGPEPKEFPPFVCGIRNRENIESIGSINVKQKPGFSLDSSTVISTIKKMNDEREINGSQHSDFSTSTWYPTWTGGEVVWDPHSWMKLSL